MLKDFYLDHKEILNKILLVLGLIMIYILTINTEEFLENKGPLAKKIELNNMVVSGYKKGKLSWLIKSKYVWSSYNLDHANLENIYEGTLYDNGKIVLKDLAARKVRTNAPQERLTALGGVIATLIREVNTETHYVNVWAEDLSYFSSDKKTYLSKSVKLKDNDIYINADKAMIDHQTNEVFIKNGFTIKKSLSDIKGNKLNMKIDSQDFIAEENVVLNRKGQEKNENTLKKENTKITCAKLTMKIADNLATAKFYGDIKIWQPDKQGFANKALFNEKNDTLTLQNNAVLIFDKSDWLIDKETISKLKNQEIKKSIQEKLTLRGDTINISTKTKNFNAVGNVKVLLKEKEAKAGNAIYDKEKETITLTNEVWLKNKDNSWVKANLVKVLVDKEEFIAEDQVETKIFLKR
jgi:lipopolysaccharide export system protein LptA